MKHNLDTIIRKIDPRLVRDVVRLAIVCERKYQGNWNAMHQDYLDREQGSGKYEGYKYVFPAKLAKRARDRGLIMRVRNEIDDLVGNY
jgi:hypothetical protein